MKTVLSIRLIALVTFFMGISSVITHAQKKESKKIGPVTETVEFMTSAQCDMCRMKIEGKLGEEKGVRHAFLDLKTKKLTVKYNPDKIKEEEIINVITSLGYDVNDHKGNQDAYNHLPDCCKKH